MNLVLATAKTIMKKLLALGIVIGMALSEAAGLSAAANADEAAQ